MNLAHRSLSSVTWNSVSNLLQVVISLVRSILLARWLALEVFDVYPLANSIIAVTAVFANFGLDGALLHRAPESEDEGEAAAIHFTLRTLLGLVWAALMIGAALLLEDNLLRLSLIVLTIAQLIKRTVRTPRLVLARSFFLVPFLALALGLITETINQIRPFRLVIYGVEFGRDH